ncbi:MAG TPA: TraB/GumN family protein [Chthoniobacterales bacterium]|nr:TraB/GumN family protein [Chthoniobacterales bacterium]
MCKAGAISSVFAGFLIGFPVAALPATCVWKVTDHSNHVMYLGGSWHALRASDYPIPSAFNRALDASSRLALEVDPNEMHAADKSISQAALYPKGDSFKNHVDPRTYNYIRRLFEMLNVPEEKFVHYRPWFIALALQSPGNRGMSTSLGVEQFLTSRARSQSKQIIGLETAREHAGVFLGLSDSQSEALLLLTFIPGGGNNGSQANLMNAWRNGNADAIWHAVHDGFRDFPSLGDRILEARNRNWIPKMEGYLRSGQAYFVVAGAAHMGGPGGVLALLRGRGYRIEQL